MNRRRSGFTLVEMLVIIAIIGMAAAVAAPSFGQAAAKMRLNAGARSLAAALRFSRMQAILEKVPCQTLVNLDRETFEVNYTPEVLTTLAAGDAPLRPIPFSRSGSRQLPDSLDIVSATEGKKPLEEGAATFVFQNDGSSVGGKIVVADEAGREATVTINPVTGFVSIDTKGPAER